jgi:arylsulfatase
MLKRAFIALVSFVFVIAAGGMAAAQPTGKQPNILIIWGDDVGYWNISAYNLGMMGYRTPNIDRIAREGALFTATACLAPSAGPE